MYMYKVHTGNVFIGADSFQLSETLQKESPRLFRLCLSTVTGFAAAVVTLTVQASTLTTSRTSAILLVQLGCQVVNKSADSEGTRADQNPLQEQSQESIQKLAVRENDATLGKVTLHVDLSAAFDAFDDIIILLCFVS